MVLLRQVIVIIVFLFHFNLLNFVYFFANYLLRHDINEYQFVESIFV